MGSHTIPRERSWPPCALGGSLIWTTWVNRHSLKAVGQGAVSPADRHMGRQSRKRARGLSGWADLRASGRPPRGSCWCCLTMSLICCVGCGKCSELRVEDRTSSRQGEASPPSHLTLGSPCCNRTLNCFLEKPSPEAEWGQPRAWWASSGPWPGGRGPQALEQPAGAQAWLGVQCLRTSAGPLMLRVSVESRV